MCTPNWAVFQVRPDVSKCKHFYKKVLTSYAAVCEGHGADAARVMSVNVWKGLQETFGGRERSITDIVYSREAARLVVSVGPDLQVEFQNGQDF